MPGPGSWSSRRHPKALEHEELSGKVIHGRRRGRPPRPLGVGAGTHPSRQKPEQDLRAILRQVVPWQHGGRMSSGSGGAEAAGALSQAHGGLGASAGDWGPYGKPATKSCREALDKPF